MMIMNYYFAVNHHHSAVEADYCCVFARDRPDQANRKPHSPLIPMVLVLASVAVVAAVAVLSPTASGIWKDHRRPLQT